MQEGQYSRSTSFTSCQAHASSMAGNRYTAVFVTQIKYGSSASPSARVRVRTGSVKGGQGQGEEQGQGQGQGHGQDACAYNAMRSYALRHIMPPCHTHTTPCCHCAHVAVGATPTCRKQRPLRPCRGLQSLARGVKSSNAMPSHGTVWERAQRADNATAIQNKTGFALILISNMNRTIITIDITNRSL